MLKRLLLLCLCTVLPLAAQTTPSPNLAGIAHVALRVKDLDASIAFYQKLGFMKAFDLARNGKVYEAFIKINDHQFIELYPADAKNPQASFLHVCFEGNDLNAVHDYYVAEGLHPIAVRTAGAGNLLFTMPGPMTPQGPQNMEYTQYMPGSLHSKDFGQHLGEYGNGARLLSVEIAALDATSAELFYTRKAAFTKVAASNSRTLLTMPGNASQSIEIARPDLGFRAAITIAEPAPPDDIARQSGTVVSSGMDLVNDPDGNMILFRRYHVLK